MAPRDGSAKLWEGRSKASKKEVWRSLRARTQFAIALAAAARAWPTRELWRVNAIVSPVPVSASAW
eukprot:scaffold1328_cov59-Phaeocystis_antarctica.AAC.3